MYSDGLLKLPIFTIQKNHKILLTVYSLSPLFDVKSRRTPWHPPARLLICVSLSEGNPAVPHRHRRPEHPHRPARQNQTLPMPCRTDGHHP